MRLEIHNSLRDPKPINPGTCLITGDGKSLMDDLKQVDLGNHHDTMAIGRSINIAPGRILHWANVDGPECIWWAEHLPPKNQGELPVRHTLGECRGYDVDWDIRGDVIWQKDDQVLWHGSSSLFSVYVALALGYEKIILAGCPMDMNGHWFWPESTGPRWNGESFIAWLEFAKTPESKRVESLSGYTRQILRNE